MNKEYLKWLWREKPEQVIVVGGSLLLAVGTFIFMIASAIIG